MKANEAPERIFINPMPSPSDGYVGIAWSEPHSKTIEYTRTDAFVEKACNAYCKMCKMPNCKGEDCKYIKDFRKYMKGEL